MIKLTRDEYIILCDAICFTKRHIIKTMLTGYIDDDIDINELRELARKLETIHTQLINHCDKSIINIGIK